MNTVQKNKRAMGWLTTAHLANDMYSGFLNPIMPFLAAKIGFSMVVATLIMSIAQICASFIQPIFGFFADNILKRVFVFWGLIFGSLFIPLGTNSPNVFLLTVCVILGNLGGSFFHPQALGYISKFSNTNFAQNMGIFITAGTVGFSLGPIISGCAMQSFGLEKIPYLSIFGIVIALSMFHFVPKISDSNIALKRKKFKKSFLDILSNKNMLILINVSVAKTLMANSCLILFPFLWKDMGYSPSYIGFALFGFLFAGGVASMLSSRIERKIGAKTVFYISLTATLPLTGLFALLYKTHPGIAFAVFVLTGFVAMLAQPVMLVMAQQILPDYKSIVSGFINGFSWGLVAIALTLVGFFAQKFGIAKIVFIVSFIPVFMSYLVRFLPDETEKSFET